MNFEKLPGIYTIYIYIYIYTAFLAGNQICSPCVRRQSIMFCKNQSATFCNWSEISSLHNMAESQVLELGVK